MVPLPAPGETSRAPSLPAWHLRRRRSARLSGGPSLSLPGLRAVTPGPAHGARWPLLGQVLPATPAPAPGALCTGDEGGRARPVGPHRALLQGPGLAPRPSGESGVRKGLPAPGDPETCCHPPPHVPPPTPTLAQASPRPSSPSRSPSAGVWGDGDSGRRPTPTSAVCTPRHFCFKYFPSSSESFFLTSRRERRLCDRLAPRRAGPPEAPEGVVRAGAAPRPRARV